MARRSRSHYYETLEKCMRKSRRSIARSRAREEGGHPAGAQARALVDQIKRVGEVVDLDYKAIHSAVRKELARQLLEPIRQELARSHPQFEIRLGDREASAAGLPPRPPSSEQIHLEGDTPDVLEVWMDGHPAPQTEAQGWTWE
jgi:hypothetical protein